MNKYLIVFDRIGKTYLQAIVHAFSKEDAREKLREHFVGEHIEIESIVRLSK